MALYVFVFLFVDCLLLSPSVALVSGLVAFSAFLLTRRGQAQHAPSSAASPRCPDDCPACRLASTPASASGPAPALVRPWCEMKSRRGAPKRVNTEGYACPNQRCAYFGITESQIHALVGDGKHGQAEQIQTFRCQACHTTFTSRCNTPLYRLKTPSHQVAIVLSALAEGIDPSAAERVFGYRQATITKWLTRAGKHAQTLHERSHLANCTSHICSWMNCAPGCAAPHRCSGSGWPSIRVPRFFPCSSSAPAPNTWLTW